MEFRRLDLFLALGVTVACGGETSSAQSDGSSGGASTTAASQGSTTNPSSDSGNSAGSGSSTSAGSSTASGPTSAGTDTGASGNCTVFPPDNPWNTDISGYPVHENSDAIIASIGADVGMHADFGTVWDGAPIGIPWVDVAGDQSRVPVEFDYADESDPGPYPIPPDAPIEGGPDGGGDRHVIAFDRDNCVLYELFSAYPQGGGSSWTAGSGAIFDLTSNDLRPDGWTSADAAGLPVFPGLVRYDEVVEQGQINHALRFTVERSRNAYIPPATHEAADDNSADLPPMGLRLRMKADYDCSGLAQEIQVICTALKTYGMFVADNGTNWYLSGAPDDRWNDDNLHDIDGITGSAFEVVYTGDPIVGN
jgi:hypothetical protein